MSGRVWVGRMLAAAATLLVLVAGWSAATTGQAAVPLPQATTATPTARTSPTPASPTPDASPTPSSSQSEVDVDPADEPTDDGSNPTPVQNGTWLALGGAAAIALLAGLIVAIRKR
ncbi:MAG: hypothetical protein QM619_14260 [Micropruina sp.]|uniref:hypothetical protein n=1 Tax=Micropruina sp. TaxID=2737536 RepID=UPI0039E7034F